MRTKLIRILLNSLFVFSDPTKPFVFFKNAPEQTEKSAFS